MILSNFFIKTQKNISSEDISYNAKLLEKAGFIYKNSSGIYTFFPLGWIVIQNIIKIIREEMSNIGALEMMMPALVSKQIWQTSGRWDVEIGYEVKSKDKADADFVLGWTHEEVISEIFSHFINSYKDLPLAMYQIQTKFRNEPRAKSGLLRGKEFIMKDLYSFHSSEDDLFAYYNQVALAYQKIFKRCGLNSIYTLASGGAFTIANTHEFQVICGAGEDEILVCSSCGYAENKEISNLKPGDKCLKCDGIIKLEKSIEVGNIFPLGEKYARDFNLKFKDKNGNENYVIMGSYGIGVGRLMGTIVELFNDEHGIIWPKEIAPALVYLIDIDKKIEAKELYNYLQNKGISVIYDDRDLSIGEKLQDADLIGLPYRLILSPKNGDLIEVKLRKDNKIKQLSKEEVINLIVKNNENIK
ncbi:MAG: His/Gly/Thr/Pro-type tRNA ligase C-terminal domain-containing protein [Patescibacteria group bacterium]|nr:His/Gly/Thr/Pro-type tRNA ligase C-terminal domain-containing protein [Patescibacteria group bacterium]